VREVVSIIYLFLIMNIYYQPNIQWKSQKDAYLINITNKSIKQFTFINKDILDKIKTLIIEKRMIEIFDKKQILSWVIFPPDFDKANKYPTLLYCLWGPQVAVNQYPMNFSLIAS